jgi:hypothetical protein
MDQILCVPVSLKLESDIERNVEDTVEAIQNPSVVLRAYMNTCMLFHHRSSQT